MATIATSNVGFVQAVPQVVTVQNTDNPRGMNIAAIRGLAITQIVFGVLSIVFGIASVSAFHYGYWINASGSGIWFGLWILITGIIGVMSAKNPSHNGLNGTNMGFNIVCTVVSFFVGIFFIVAVVYYSACDSYYYNRYSYRQSYYNWGCYGDKQAGTAVYTVLLILMIAEFFVSMVAAIFCCQGGCCAPTHSTGVIIQPQQPTFVATSTGVVTSTQYQGHPPVTGYQQPYVYPAGSYPQSTSYPQGTYPPQQYVTTAAPMGAMQMPPTYSVDQPQDGNKIMPPPPYAQ